MNKHFIMKKGVKNEVYRKLISFYPPKGSVGILAEINLLLFQIGAFL